MMQIQKTVFILGRHTTIHLARAVYQELTAHGYDCLLDCEVSSDNHEYELAMKRQIAARAHFIAILMPSSLYKYRSSEDPMVKRIRYALDSKRNVVCLTFEPFNPTVLEQYIGYALWNLFECDIVEIPPTYFDEAITRLRTRHLEKAVEVTVELLPIADQSEALIDQILEMVEPKVLQNQVTAERWLERGLWYQTQKQWEAAIDAFSAVPAVDRSYITVFYESLIASISYPRTNTLKLLNERVERNPEASLAYLTRGIARLEFADVDGAIEDFSEAIRFGELVDWAYFWRGLARYKSGDLSGAIAEYDDALWMEPNLALSYYYRSLAKHEGGDVRGAKVDEDEAARLYPNRKMDALAYYYRGDANVAKDDLEEAERNLGIAIWLDAKAGQAYSLRSKIRLRLEDGDGALADADAFIRIKGTDAYWGYRLRAEAHIYMEKFDDAIADYTAVLSLNPKWYVAYYERALVHEKKGDLRTAREDYLRYLEIEDKKYEFYWMVDYLIVRKRIKELEKQLGL